MTCQQIGGHPHMGGLHPMSFFFLNTVTRQRGESPIAGEIKKCHSGLVRIGFVCPLGALACKLAIFAGCGHGGHSNPDDQSHLDGLNCSKVNTICNYWP
jgi:hypothetical protein